MTKPRITDNAASKLDDKLHKLIKRAKKQHGEVVPVSETGR
jgi:hypothetical protein